jgi:disulfide bond formation protein DsbB
MLMKFSTTRTCQAVWLVFLLTTVTIAGAWGFELIGGYKPCALCYQQRIPYYVIVPFSFMLFVLCATGNHMRLVRYGLIACTLVMLISAGLGINHAGVEWGWWPGPSECTGGAGLSSGSVLPDLDTARVVNCGEVQWQLFGLSFAGWNAVISLIAALIALWGARQPR